MGERRQRGRMNGQRTVRFRLRHRRIDDQPGCSGLNHWQLKERRGNHRHHQHQQPASVSTRRNFSGHLLRQYQTRATHQFDPISTVWSEDSLRGGSNRRVLWK